MLNCFNSKWWLHWQCYYNERMDLLTIYVDPETYYLMLSFLLLKSSSSQNVDGIKLAIKSALDKKDLTELQEKLFFLCSDGAYVNSGLKSGFKWKIKDKILWLIFSCCLCHRLYLIISDAISDWMGQVHDYLTNFFHL